MIVAGIAVSIFLLAFAMYAYVRAWRQAERHPDLWFWGAAGAVVSLQLVVIGLGVYSATAS